MKLKDVRKEYNTYFDVYLNKLNSNDNIIDRLNNNLKTVHDFFDDLDEEFMKFSYSDKKWTVAQILQHIIDTERIFNYRALKIVRENNPNIDGYNHESYANSYKFMTKDSLLQDYHNNRKASISLFNTFDDIDLLKSVNQDHYKFKAGLIPFIFCGHELHHIDIVKEKYFS